MAGGFLPALGCREIGCWASQGGIWDKRLAKGKREPQSQGSRQGTVCSPCSLLPPLAGGIFPITFFKLAQSQRGLEDLEGMRTTSSGQKVAPTIGTLRPALRQTARLLGEKNEDFAVSHPSSYYKSIGSVRVLQARRETVHRLSGICGERATWGWERGQGKEPCA